MKYFVNVTRLATEGSALLAPIKDDRDDPDWELTEHKEVVMQDGQGNALILIVCYWRQNAPSRLN